RSRDFHTARIGQDLRRTRQEADLRSRDLGRARVERDLGRAAFHFGGAGAEQVRVGSHVQLGAGARRGEDVRALELDLPRRQDALARADLERHLVGGLEQDRARVHDELRRRGARGAHTTDADHDLVGDADVVLPRDRDTGTEIRGVFGVALARSTIDDDVVAPLDIDRIRTVDRRFTIFIDRDDFVAFDAFGSVVPDAERLVVADRRAHVVLDDLVVVLLRVEEDLFFASRVFEAELVEPLAARRALRLDRALRLLVGEGVRRGRFPVVDAAGDERTIGVALEERDDDLHPDARHEQRPPLRTRPGLRDANPAGGFFVVRGRFLPMELDHDPAQLVGVDLLARGTDDDAGLDALDAGLGRQLSGAQRDGGGDA